MDEHPPKKPPNPAAPLRTAISGSAGGTRGTGEKPPPAAGSGVRGASAYRPPSPGALHGPEALRLGSAPKAQPLPKDLMAEVAAAEPALPVPLEIDLEATVRNPSEPPASTKSSRPPTRLPKICDFGRFELLGRLAFGGMAEILFASEATSAGARRYLVIKRILAHVADDESFVRMFLDEARLVMQLSHANICHIYEFGREEGSYFIAMEWVNGFPLGKLIRRARSKGGIPSPLAVRIIAQTAEALHYAHRAKDQSGRPLGIVHRDVSPQNIMVSYEGAVKLLDFGIARAKSHSSRTQAGVIKGKFAYMSPQQCLGHPVDARTDVFALGICLYEALTGKSLYRRENEYETMQAVVSGPVPSLRQVKPALPAELDTIVQKALQKKAEDRFQTAGEMQDALEEWLAKTGSVVGRTRLADFMESLFEEEIRRGPLVDTEPFGGSMVSARAATATDSRSGETGAFLTAADEQRQADGRSRRRLLVVGGVALTIAIAVATSIAWLGAAEREPPLDAAPGLAVPRVPPDRQLPGETAPSAEGTGAPVEPTPSPPQAATTGTVTVRSDPSGARVQIGAHDLEGTTPTEIGDLEAGTYPVSVRRGGYRPWTGEVVVEAGGEAEIDAILVRAEVVPATPPGRLSINTRPWSRVYVRGRLLGTTPIGALRVPSGTVALRLVDRDGRTHNRSVHVGVDEDKRVFFDLSHE